MDASTRSAKRRKLDHPFPNASLTPTKGANTPSYDFRSQRRSTRSKGLLKGKDEPTSDSKIVQTDTGPFGQFSDVVAAYKYKDRGPEQEDDDHKEVQKAGVGEEDLEPDPETPSRHTRGKRATPQRTNKTTQKPRTGLANQSINAHLQGEDGSAHIIAKDGAISGLGNGADVQLSPRTIGSREAQQHSTESMDKIGDLQKYNDEESENNEPPRSSRRQRQKSRKVLEQEAVQPSVANNRGSIGIADTKTKASKQKNEGKSVSTPHESDEITSVSRARVVEIHSEGKKELALRSSSTPPKRRKSLEQGSGKERKGVQSRQSRAHRTEAHQVTDPISGDDTNETGPIEEELGVLPFAKISDPPSPFLEQSDSFQLEIVSDQIATGSISNVSGVATAPQPLLLQRIIMDRITGLRPIPLTNLSDEYAKIHNLVSQTVTAGEGNSMLIIGARGSGKTALIDAVISDLYKDHRDEFHVIRLNGFIQTDDKLALREIWRQLGREMEVEDEGEAVGKHYADTLATLLALLSHPSELAGQETEAVAKSVVFVMDEFDLFAMHPRQTLLYNLFDIAQSRKAPIAVLGLTTRLDVAEGLEKRVKSRWSHRYVHVPLAKSLVAFQQVVRAALVVEMEQLSFEERTTLAASMDRITPPTKKKVSANSQSQDVLTAWNSCIDSLLAHPPFSTLLSRTYTLSKSIPTVLTSLLPGLSALPTSPTFPPPPSFFLSGTPANNTPNPQNLLLAPPSSNLHLLPSLPTLSLALLIAAARLEIIHASESCNFHLAYAEYVSLASKARVQQTAQGALAWSGGVGGEGRVWGRAVAWGLWEELVGYGLLVPVLGGGGAGGGGGGLVGEMRVRDAAEMVRCDVGLEEIGMAVPEMGSVLLRWCKEI
ncbi:MAG: hypothetical protein Q9165_002538 [Trypethelium subeluteriae]